MDEWILSAAKTYTHYHFLVIIIQRTYIPGVKRLFSGVPSAFLPQTHSSAIHIHHHRVQKYSPYSFGVRTRPGAIFRVEAL